MRWDQRTPRGRRFATLLIACALCSSPVACGSAGTTQPGQPSPTPGASAPPTGGAISIGEWQDAPGVCPSGMPQVDLDSVEGLKDASRGEGAYAADAPGTCYFIRNGTYQQPDRTVLLYILRGGTSAAPRYFVGESRSNVVLRGRATVGDADDPNDRLSNVVLANLTFDLSGGLPGYGSDDAFNTLTLNGTATNVKVDHVSFTGDCAHGLRGGHIETDGVTGLEVDSALVENFGNCGGDGHEDHGIYLAGGAEITLRNSVIRGNSSRGIQLYTQGGQYGTLSNILIERNRIYANGHRDYEDGIVINGSDTGTITNVTVQHNLIYRNYYSGIRFAGPATSGIQVTRNTFYSNGSGSSSSDRSEINIDDPGEAVGTSIGRNIFSVGNALINACFDALDNGFSLDDNVVQGAASSESCVRGIVAADPEFADPAAGDFRTGNPAVAGYGAYSP
jgi:Right handed beta helix region